MADNSVFISGVAAGAFAEAMDGLPEWASERTAVRIEELLKKSLGIQTKALQQMVKCCHGGENVDPELIKEANDEFEQLGKNLDKRNKEFDRETQREKDRKKWHDQAGLRQKEEGKYSSIFKVALLDLGMGIKQVYVDNVATFDKMLQSGINVVNGMNGVADGFQSLQQLSALTGVRFTELSQSMMKFSGAVNEFGTGRFAKTVANANANLRAFGFSTKETADLLGAYLEIQRGYTSASSRTQEQVQKDLVGFGQRITRLSLATGMMRNQIIENVDAISKTIEANLLSAKTGAAASQNTQEFLGSLRNADLRGSMLRMMTDAIAPLNDTFMDFQKLGFGDFGQEFMDFTRSLEGLDPEQARQKMAEFVGNNEMQMDRMMQQANLLRQAGMRAEADSVMNKIIALRQEARATKAVSKEEQEKMKASAKASADIRSAYEKFLAQLQITFVPMISMLEGITWTLEAVDSVLTKARSWASMIESYINSFDVIKNTVGEIKPLQFAGAALAIYAFIKSVKLLSMAFGALFSTITGAGRLIFGSQQGRAGVGLPQGNRGYGAGSPRGRGNQTGPGKSGPWLSGVAQGLASLGNPRVFLGIAALAAMSAPIYLAGKAFKQFSDVNWKDVALGSATIGILAVASAPLAFLAPKIIIASAAFTALGGALYVVGSALKNFPTGIFSVISNSVGSVATGVKEVFTSTSTAVSSLFSLISPLANAALSSVSSFATSVMNTLGNAFGSARNFVSNLFGGFKKEASNPELVKSLATTVESVDMTSLKALVETVNSLNLLKVAGLQSITKIRTVSLPEMRPTAGMARTLTPNNGTINSPSSPSINSITTDASGTTRAADGTIINRPANTATSITDNINTLFDRQIALLQQLNQTSENMLSINRDILKYTKVSA